MLAKITLLFGTLCFFYPINAQTSSEFDFSVKMNTPLEKKFGGYSPEKVLWVNSIYDSTRTLGPLNLKFNRFQLDVNEVSAQDPRWKDPGNSQEYIIKTSNALGITSFVTINTHPNVKGSDAGMKTFFSSIAQSLVDFSEGNTIYLELFGEPDLGTWDWYTGYTNFDKFWHEFKTGYDAVAAIREDNPNLRIGGCGFAWAHVEGSGRSEWYDRWIDSCIVQDIKLDFVSYHHYLLWKGSEWLINTDQDLIRHEIDISNEDALRYKNSAAAEGRDVEIVISEYSWPHGDWNTAFAEARSFLTYRNTARTFESLMYMGLDVIPEVDLIFWAQGIGQYIEGWFDYDFMTFFPFCNWHFYKDNKTFYTYNAAYHAFWFYGMLPETRNLITFSNNDFYGLASSDSLNYYLVVWNRTGETKELSLAFTGLDGAAEEYLVYKYEANNTYFDKYSQFLEPELLKLDMLNSHTFEPEATLMLVFSKNNCSLTDIKIDPIEDKSGTAAPFEIHATSSVGSDLLYSVVSGPATIQDNIVTLVGIEGTINLMAYYEGDSAYCPAYSSVSFQVLPVQGAFAVHTIPGIVEAEDFDLGGEGLAYHDSDTRNIGGEYRPLEAVDIGKTGERYFIGWIFPGEWVEYTVNVLESGDYSMAFFYATNYNDATIKFTFNGIESESWNVPATNSWTSFETAFKKIHLDSGKQIMRISFESGNMFFDKVDFQLSTSINADYPVYDNIQIYPNPASKNITVTGDLFGRSLENPEGALVYSIIITDLQGRVLISSDEPVAETKSISVSGLEKGIYLIVIKSGNLTWARKFLKE